MPDPLSSVEVLTPDHDVSRFDCGKPELTTWCRRWALVNQQNGSARVFVMHRTGRVCGYYAIAAAAVERTDTPGRVSKGLAQHPIPVILLARLAVDESEQGKGLGSALLRDALIRILHAAEEIGIRAVLVHAQDDEAVAFYEHFGFEPSPTDPQHLFLLVKDIRSALEDR